MIAPVYAIVVVVEEYLESKWTLAGARVDAWLITKQLIRLGVLPENIAVFLSPATPQPELNFEELDVKVRGADRATIEQEIKHELKKRTEEWLFFFWGGHGVVETDHFRRVLYADAQVDDKLNLDLNNLLIALRSNRYPARTLMNQVIVVDACGTEHATLNASTELPPSSPLPIGTGASVAARKQWFFLSSSPGEKAAHGPPPAVIGAAAGLRATGVYTSVFLKLLSARSWPCDWDELNLALRREFEERNEQRKKEGKPPQTPSLFFLDSAGGGYSTAGDVIGIPPLPTRVPIDRAALAGAISRLGLFQSEHGREAFIESLPLALNRPQPAQLTTDALALADACSTQPFAFEALIDRCEQLGSAGLQGFAEQLDALHPTHAVGWADCVSLRASLQAAGPLPSDEEAARAYRQTPAASQAAAKAPLPPWTTGRVFLFHILNLAQYLPPGQSLILYLKSCRRPDRPKLSAVIDEWVAMITPRLPAESLAPEQTGAATTAQSPFLQIKISPLKKSGPPEEWYFPAIAWWRGSGALTPLILEEAIKPGASPENETSGWPDFINRAFLAALDYDPGATFCVEAIVPMDHFECEIDGWEVEDGASRSRLGSQYPVVIRPYERLYEPAYRGPKAKWVRKWEQWRSQPASPRVPVAGDSSAYHPAFFSALEREAVGLVAWTLEPAAPPLPDWSPRQGVIAKMISAGVPIALCWRRSPPAGAADRQRFADWLIGENLGTWPEKIWEHRRNSPHVDSKWTADEWPPLTLLWDSPDHLPPDYQHRAQAPTQRPSV